jgi:large subunit ribosomal protein L24
MHVKNGDKVQVMTGRESGRTGTVKCIDKKCNRVTVDGLNMVKRHKRAGATDAESGIIEKEAFIDASNVLIFSEKLERGVRTSVRYVGDGGAHFNSKIEAAASFSEAPSAVQKVRLCVKTGEVFE